MDEKQILELKMQARENKIAEKMQFLHKLSTDLALSERYGLIKVPNKVTGLWDVSVRGLQLSCGGTKLSYNGVCVFQYAFNGLIEIYAYRPDIHVWQALLDKWYIESFADYQELTKKKMMEENENNWGKQENE